MWQKLKALPPIAKVVIGLFVIAVLYGAARRPPNPTHNYGEYPPTPRPGEEHASQGSDDDQKAQLLARYQAQHAQLVAMAQQCQVQMQEAMNQQAAAAMNGQMYTGRPACEQQMPQLVSQMALLETEIYRLQTGDTHSSVREITHIAAPDLRSSPSSGGGGDDGGLHAVDNYDRQAIRGTSMYSDESGEEHELPTATYYYRDRSSGQFVPSESPDPPNDGRDYERLTAQH